jgi:hypothetical protein
VKPWLTRAAVAVLAVALGITVGAGPLQRSNSARDNELTAQKAKVDRLQHRIDALESTAAFADAYATTTGPALVRGTLAGRSIALITLPGADPALVTRLRAGLDLAQAHVTAQVALAPTMASSSSRQLVEALTSQMITQAPSVTVPPDATGYQRFGALLARALGTGPTGDPAQAAYDETAVSIVSGLQSAELVTTIEPVSARAGLAVVVTGPEADTATDAAENAVPVTILQALAQQLPTVVVGPTGAAGGRGVIGALRASPAATGTVSTVDSAETAMGQVAAVLALTARTHGTVGSFGAVDAADGVLPGATP